jgi:hypothetical protein
MSRVTLIACLVCAIGLMLALDAWLTWRGTIDWPLTVVLAIGALVGLWRVEREG